MFDTIINFWHSLPWFIQWPINFWFTVIVMRGIVANEITNELEKRGWLRRGWLHGVVEWVKDHLPNFDRHAAIWYHYKNGHKNDSVLVCNHGHCTVFHK